MTQLVATSPPLGAIDGDIKPPSITTIYIRSLRRNSLLRQAPSAYISLLRKILSIQCMAASYPLGIIICHIRPRRNNSVLHQTPRYSIHFCRITRNAPTTKPRRVTATQCRAWMPTNSADCVFAKIVLRCVDVGLYITIILFWCNTTPILEAHHSNTKY